MLVILVAHYAEATAFLQHYGLDLDHASGSKSRYVSAKVCLRITGEGRENIQCALEKELSIAEADDKLLWLNFGVAGSSQYAISAILEATILENGESSDGSQGYKLIPRGTSPNTSCYSFLTPQEKYPDKGVVDMEAYYIAQMLQSAGLLENLSVIKLVVDGPSNPISQLSFARLNSYLADARQNLTEISDRLIM